MFMRMPDACAKSPLSRDTDWRGFAIREAGLVPAGCGRGMIRLASGHEAGADSWALASAYDARVAVWTIGRQAIRTVERQSGSGMRRWGV